MRRFFAHLFASRYALRVGMLIALLILGINEYTYRTTTTVLRGGIALTDERISTGRLLQTLTDAETSQRGYLLTQDAAFLAKYKAAIAELPKLRVTVVPFLDLHNPASSKQINDIIDNQLVEMATTVELAERGQSLPAIDIVKAGAGSQWMDKLRQIFDTELASAAKRQSVARLSIYDALDVNHVAVILLTISSILALYVFIRQLRLRECERAATEARLEAAVEKRTHELRELTKHLQTVREAEKDHLARELHDQLGALLTVAKLDLEGLRKRVEPSSDVATRIARLTSRINDMIVLKRRMVEDMRPSSLSMLGLRTALEHQCRDMADAMGVPFHVNIAEITLTPDAELVIFRFVQEALTNIAKYAEAKNVWVELLKSGNQLHILVRDDGKGFDPELAQVGRHGLTGMRYRIDSLGGSMTLTSKHGEGTAIRASVTA